jgi:site-specific DNA-methyltransferase (adenine-specific)
MINMMQGDCMDFMRGKPDKFWNLAIVDPPYGIGRDCQTSTVCKNSKHNRKEFKKGNWDGCTPDKNYFDEIFRVSKNQIIWGANYFTEFLPPSMGWIFWDKGQDLSMSDGELAFTSFDRALRRKTYNRSEIARDGSIHPTQKPVKLYEWLLMNYTKPGDKILDTHGGSGSICIACHNLGFDLDWIELDPEYYRDALKRFEIHKAQLRMF